MVLEIICKSAHPSTSWISNPNVDLQISNPLLGQELLHSASVSSYARRIAGTKLDKIHPYIRVVVVQSKARKSNISTRIFDDLDYIKKLSARCCESSFFVFGLGSSIVPPIPPTGPHYSDWRNTKLFNVSSHTIRLNKCYHNCTYYCVLPYCHRNISVLKSCWYGSMSMLPIRSY